MGLALYLLVKGCAGAIKEGLTGGSSITCSGTSMDI